MYIYKMPISINPGDLYKLSVNIKTNSQINKNIIYSTFSFHMRPMKVEKTYNEYVVFTNYMEYYKYQPNIVSLQFNAGMFELQNTLLLENINDHFSLDNNNIFYFTTEHPIENEKIIVKYHNSPNAFLINILIIYIIFCIIIFDIKKIFSDNITNIDIFLFTSIIIFLYFSLQQGDIITTIKNSFSYLNGHIIDFYSYNLNNVIISNYYPSTYIVFAIWNIPLKIFSSVVNDYTINNYVIWYNKLLPVLAYIFSFVYIYKISRLIGLSKLQSKIIMFMGLTTPIAIYSQFFHAQYDSFTLLFMTISYYYYLNNNNNKFILYFAIALTFKYNCIFYFIVLLILKEKNILKITKSFLFGISLIILETIMYIWDKDFIKSVLQFSANSFILSSNIEIAEIFGIKLFLFSWIILIFYIYFSTKKEYNMNELFIKSIFYCSCVSFLLFGLAQWHPNWLILSVPFLVFSHSISKNRAMFIFLDIVLMLFFIIFFINRWPASLNSYMLQLGIFNDILTPLKSGILMSELLPDPTLTSYTCISAILFLNVLFKSKKYIYENIYDFNKLEVTLIRLRLILGVLMFVIPAILVTSL
ncbi:hypothetical protein SU46_00950 [Brachyspira hyodysenteriae]|nr:hypothetical protein SU46_00950 [Brachyspira hyodysenteriae]